MKLYADAPARRARQIVGDLLLVAWVVIWVRIGRGIHDATLVLAKPGEEMAKAGSGLSGKLQEAGEAVSGLPVVGGHVQAPFDGAAGAADQLRGAGEAQVAAVGDLALWLGIAIGAIPIVIMLALYVPFRVAFVVRATAAQRFIDADADLDLFAMRALARQPMHRLARVSDDPSGAWRRGDAAVIRQLANLELADVGLRPPAA